MTKKYRPTWAEIDLDAIKYNVEQIKTCIKKDVEIMPVVKANAYGHGICEIARLLVSIGINYLGVATVDEALRLRRSGIPCGILILGATLEDEALIAASNDITVTLCNDNILKILVEWSKKTGQIPKVHVKIDTGMGRIGVWHEEAFSFIKRVVDTGCIDLEGVYTHFSAAGRDELYTSLQIEYFDGVLEEMDNAGIKVKYRHASNSLAVVDWKKAHLNLIRPGILIYGIYPKETFRRSKITTCHDS
ncbi:alanine racemase [Candidatus Omnitrophus magneticus]|uniref:Alanine racemase n=1 Tax=Candidatus Omnitrophus magneticus TaxID=1609969 RepID=A0A0F0CNM5_9BACT|nr:alanine racemase [Candidatus Omnitrophus magneticus]